MLGDPFASPKRRLARARQHISDLRVAIQAFYDGGPYRMTVSELDPKSGNTIHKVKVIRRPSDEINNIVSEGIEALRSTLDQAAYVTAARNGTLHPKSAYFPFAETLVGLEASIKGRCKDIPSEILTLFDLLPLQGRK